MLFGAGGVFAEQILAARHKPGRVRGRVTALVANAVIALPLTLPVLPAYDLPRSGWEGQVNKDLSATVGGRSWSTR